jgi:colicin import membrane protein
MKAALEAWGSQRNLFHDGTAEETEDAAIVTATLAQPGVVLRRPVGSSGVFKEKPDALKDLPAKPVQKADTTRVKLKSRSTKSDAADKKASSAAILSFKEAKAKRDADNEAREKREAAQRKKDETRIKQAVSKAEESLDRARTRHEAALAELERDREELEKRAAAEKERWDGERRKLEDALRRAAK